MRAISLVFAGLVLAIVCGTAAASDIAKEQRWREQIVDSLLDGEAVDLQAGSQTFLGIYTESAEAGSRRAAVVIHGTGIHPNWATVIQPLRVGLAESGWHTLSIQMPILANDAAQADYTALFPEAPPRIQAAVHYLREQAGAETVVLVAHSLGAGMTAYALARHPFEVAGFVAVGLGSGADLGHPDRDNLAHLARIRLPMLDLYGSDDLPGVVASAADRARAAAHNAGYRQVREPGADHFFDGEEAALLTHVRGFLDGL